MTGTDVAILECRVKLETEREGGRKSLKKNITM
jgi:hypothetical protein